MNASESIKDTENSLRDLITLVLREEFGENWLEQCGVTPERISEWQERKKEDKQTNEQRIIYYADFYDLSKCIIKNWTLFAPIFKEQKRIQVFLDLLNDFRNTNAHGRELLPFQSNLIVGICGYICSNIIMYRSKKETSEDCFARLEFAQDNLGNSLETNSTFDLTHTIFGAQILRPDDTLEFVVKASDPQGAELEYYCSNTDNLVWKNSNRFLIRVRESDVGKSVSWAVYVRSPRKHSAYSSPFPHDDRVMFVYKVLPK